MGGEFFQNMALDSDRPVAGVLFPPEELPRMDWQDKRPRRSTVISSRLLLGATMAIGFQSDEEVLRKLRQRPRKMTDEELVKFGKGVRRPAGDPFQK
jgi:hypothetical protein